MALDPTSRESNVRDSIKKYFVDNIERSEGIKLSFDISLAAPKIQGIEVDKWVVVDIGEIDPDTMSEVVLNVIVCTKQDPEGFKLAQLRDKVLGYLVDSEQTDCLARIPFYRSYPDRAWELLGSFLVFNDTDSGQMTAADGTKFKILPCRLKWGSKP